MALKYGTTSPTAIKYNGTDLTVLKYGSTAVWGKPYSLSISAGTQTNVTVTRTSSPNQGASTGTLSSGSVVYYGDVLKITASANSGYNLSTFTVNGNNFTSGNTITVTSAITIVANSVASKSWKTVWTGSKSFSGWNMNKNTIQIVSLSGFTGVVALRENTRITGTFGWYEENWNCEPVSLSFTNFSADQTIYQNTLSTRGDISDFTQGTYSGTPPYCFFNFGVTGDGQISVQAKVLQNVGNWCNLFYTYPLKITKVEQYY